MGTWSIYPSGTDSNTGEEFATIDANNGTITFAANPKTERTFTVTYNDGSGNTASETITQASKCDGYPNHSINIGGTKRGNKTIEWSNVNFGTEDELNYGEYWQFGVEQVAGNLKIYDPSYTGWTNDDCDALLNTQNIAKASWGSDWDMPSKEDIEHLIGDIENGLIEYTWETNFKGSGMNGGKFSGNGRYIFIPAAGIYDENGVQQGVGIVGYIMTTTPSGEDDDCQHKFLALRVSEPNPSINEKGYGLYSLPNSYGVNARGLRKI